MRPLTPGARTGLEYRENADVSRGKIGLFRELEEQSGPHGPLQSGFHCKDFDQQVDNDHFPKIFSEAPYLSLLRDEQVRDNGKKGGLPGSIRSQEAPESAFRHTQRHASESFFSSLFEPPGYEGLLQSFDFDRPIHRRPLFKPNASGIQNLSCGRKGVNGYETAVEEKGEHNFS